MPPAHWGWARGDWPRGMMPVTVGMAMATLMPTVPVVMVTPMAMVTLMPVGMAIMARGDDLPLVERGRRRFVGRQRDCSRGG